MASVTLSEVQSLNFAMIELVRDAAREDLATACCRFGLSKRVLECISMMSHSSVLSLVEHAGDEPLFVPRQDINHLIAAHPVVLPVLATLPKRHVGQASATN